MFHFVDSFTGEAAFLEGRIARPRRHSLAMATFFMVYRFFGLTRVAGTATVL
jgi:hypothetical protein